VALLLPLLLGLSRVHLGVHDPTDMLAGWAGGLAWASLCWLVAHMLRRRGMIRGYLQSAGIALPAGVYYHAGIRPWLPTVPKSE